MKRLSSRNRRRRDGAQRGVILLLACFSMPVLIGILGLGLDLSVMYSIKARLQMACDGASVAALRSLSLAQDTASQRTMAESIAQQWFNANFAGSYLGATGTTAPTVTVTDLASIRTVNVSANTFAPTYFMKYWGRSSTLIGASGETSRRDVAIMMVLDRSGSMGIGNYNGFTPCQVMVQAAKQFTGMFQQGRDRIGLITFAESVQIAQSPTTNFQSALGYTNSSGSSAGILDTIGCNGGTNTSTAVSLGWNELYKLQLPGALNILVVFTDGTPTAGTFDFRGSFTASSGCVQPANWVANRQANSGSALSFGPNSFFGNINGNVGALYGDLTNRSGVSPFYSPPGQLLEDIYGASDAPGCSFGSGDPTTDIAFVPAQDVWNNSSTGYHSGVSSGNIPVDQTNIGNLVFNLTDNAANFARSSHIYSNGVVMPGTMVSTIGLGGNGGGVDFTLLQRMANDPNGNNKIPYPPYPGYNQNQPVGQFVYSADPTQLPKAFITLGSQILRISR